MKPYFFCDVDGVLNALPLENQYVPPKTIAYSETELSEHNSQIIDHRKFYVPEKHFLLNKTNDFIYWNNTDYQLRIHWSEELIQQIRELIRQDKVEFVWLTMWNEHANRLLNKLFKFPKKVVNWHVEQKWNDAHQSSKYDTISQFYSKLEKDERRPFIWVDDVATEPFTTWPTYNQYAPQHLLNPIKKDLGVDALILQTDPRFGITREQWNAITHYIETGKVPRRRPRKKLPAPVRLITNAEEF